MHQCILPGTEGVGDRGTSDGQDTGGISLALPAEITRTEVIESWRRVLDDGTPANRHAPQHLNGSEVEDRRRSNTLGEGARRLQRVFGETADDTDLILGVFDADGVLLWRGGTTRWLTVADRLELTEGTRWDEKSTATTAVGLVMADPRPTRVVGVEHYEEALQSLYCAAAPILHPRTGAMIGIVGLAGPVDDLQPSATAFAASMAALAEHEIAAAHTRSLTELRRTAGARLTGVRGPALLVDNDGWVADFRGCSAPDSVAVPTEGDHQFVPGIGDCMAQPLGPGWLLRPVGPSSPIVAELDLRGKPSLTVVGDGDQWRTELTHRHAEILLLLADASESGLTSSRLSRLLFGDSGHVVTVRAEMSRLRRAVGALITNRPYRLAAGITVRVAAGEASLGRQITAPDDAPAPPGTPRDGTQRRPA